VDELYAKESRAWKSKHFVPTVSFMEVQGLHGGDARTSTLADLESAAGRRKSGVVYTEDVADEKD
jgi:hypothetical protein